MLSAGANVAWGSPATLQATRTPHRCHRPLGERRHTPVPVPPAEGRCLLLPSIPGLGGRSVGPFRVQLLRIENGVPGRVPGMTAALPLPRAR